MQGDCLFGKPGKVTELTISQGNFGKSHELKLFMILGNAESLVAFLLFFSFSDCAFLLHCITLL